MDPEAIYHAIGIARRRPSGTATLKVLIDHGADVNFMSKRWCTPLHYAVHQNLKDRVKVLVDHSADPNIVPPLVNGISPLRLARSSGYSELCEVMEAAQSHRTP